MPFIALTSQLDNLTHSLVGLFLARAGFRHATPRATAIMVLAANIPDFDAVSAFGGATSYLHWHRNIAHSLIAAPFLALLAVAIIRLAGRRGVRWLAAWSIALIAIASHLLLDLTNIYGVRLLLPFSGRWFHWDLTPVIDLTIWAMLLLGIAAPALIGLVGSEIGEKNPEAGKRGWAMCALLLVGIYNYGRNVLHTRASSQVDSHVYNGLAPRRSGAFPSGNPLKWTGIAELSNAYVVLPIDLRTNVHTSDADVFYKGPRSAPMSAAMTSHAFQVMLEFVQWPLWQSEPAPGEGGATRVTLLDLRFGDPRQPGFAATAIVDEHNRVLNAEFGMGQVKLR